MQRNQGRSTEELKNLLKRRLFSVYTVKVELKIPPNCVSSLIVEPWFSGGAALSERAGFGCAQGAYSFSMSINLMKLRLAL